MVRQVSRWCVIGLIGCLGGSVPAAAQFAFRTDASPVDDASRSASGDLHGVVRDARGVPLAGAVVSAFSSSALGSTSVYAFSDHHGRFAFRHLPAGVYHVRVFLDGYVPGRARKVHVASDAREALPTIIALSRRSETPLETITAGLEIAAGAEAPAAPAPPEKQEPNEAAWRLRHAPRSVLKDAEAFAPGGADAFAGPSSDGHATALFVEAPSLNGEVNLLTTASFGRPQDLHDSDETSRPVAYLALATPATGGEWTFRGAITQGDLASWVLAGSFVRRAGSRHEYEAGLSYAMQRYRGGNADALAATSDGSRNVGTVYAYDTWTVHPRVGLSYGARVTEYDYLDDDRVLVSPQASIVVEPVKGDTLRVRASALHRESAPGGDEFLPPAAGMTLPPQRTFSPLGDYGLRPERVDLVEVAAERRWGGSLVIGVRAFRQQVVDQTVTVFGLGVGEDDRPGIGHYHVASGGDFRARGWGVRASRALGSGVHAAVEYTQAEAAWVAWSPDALALADASGSLLRTAERIHDVTASLQSVIAPTATRVVVLYKVNSAFARDDVDASSGTNARFDLQVNQSLPFLAATGAQWEMIVAVSNFFRSALPRGSVYDELLVLRAPTRVLGGVTVRF